MQAAYALATGNNFHLILVTTRELHIGVSECLKSIHACSEDVWGQTSFQAVWSQPWIEFLTERIMRKQEGNQKPNFEPCKPSFLFYRGSFS